jgi:nucleoid-associated protein YgaU
LPSLAARLYGSEKRWREIYEANKHVVLRGVLEPGQWILIP